MKSTKVSLGQHTLKNVRPPCQLILKSMITPLLLFKKNIRLHRGSGGRVDRHARSLTEGKPVQGDGVIDLRVARDVHLIYSHESGVPLRFQKGRNMKYIKYGIFSCIKTSFSVIFNKEIHALRGLLSQF